MSRRMKFTICRASLRFRYHSRSRPRRWQESRSARSTCLSRAAPRRKGRFYNAGSSECFGDTGTRAANEQTAFRPKSPYGVAKAASISLVATYRESYGLFACSGLLFNHESPLRPTRFVTRKITAAAAKIAAGSGARLALGNLSIRRDWGWAPDYVEAMWRMLQCDR